MAESGNTYREDSSNSGPKALILAGYNRVNFCIRLRQSREIRSAYDGEDIYIGKNKFLHDLNGKPVIQYVIDAAHNATLEGKPLYDQIYVYNDVKSFKKMIDPSQYRNLVLKQMKKSVGGHLRDFYQNHVDYGERVDIFFGDTPRVTSADIEWIHDEYNQILGKKKESRGNLIRMIFSIVEAADLHDNWLPHRMQTIKYGKNKGKLKSFVGFDTFQARVGNSGAFMKHPSLDTLVDLETINFAYNMRKALTPNNFSKILYHLWKAKKQDLIRQLKQRCIIEKDYIPTVIDVFERMLKIDLSDFGPYLFHIKKNAARWENDIDGPRDLECIRENMK